MKISFKTDDYFIGITAIWLRANIPMTQEEMRWCFERTECGLSGARCLKIISEPNLCWQTTERVTIQLTKMWMMLPQICSLVRPIYYAFRWFRVNYVVAFCWFAHRAVLSISVNLLVHILVSAVATVQCAQWKISAHTHVKMRISFIILCLKWLVLKFQSTIRWIMASVCVDFFLSSILSPLDLV